NTTTLNLVHYTSSTITTWSAPQAITVDSTGYIQCHSEVKLYDGQYQLLLSDNPLVHLRFYTSSDGLTWHSENTNNPVLTGRAGYWDEKIYKSSFVKTNDLYKVWYGGFTNSWVAKVGYTQYPSLDGIASITVTTPNGGETWQRYTSHAVTWDYAGSPGSTVKIVLLKAGTEVGTIAASVPIGTGGKGSYSWPIYYSTPGNDFKVSVQSISQPTIKDVSNNYFNITTTTPPPTITVTSPNGGETWQRYTSHAITWEYTGSPGSTVKIVLLKSGTVVGTIAASVPIGTGGKGSYTWPIYYGTPGSDFKVSVQSISQPTIKDVSNNNFILKL
ncbi:MAG: GPI anchored serine-threonine rich family protein, partial [Methanoregula sp.]|nr:GPI anchored serine-threonine rich family protein [Methanoregula sp.]